MSSSYNNLYLDQTTNIYDIFSQSAGIGYRANVFVSRKSRHFFSFGISGGFGIIFPILRDSVKTLEYNTFFETQASIAYGVLFGKSRNHQVYFLGAIFQPKFFGAFEKDKFTQIGSTKIEWYEGFYIPLSIGVGIGGYIVDERVNGLGHSWTANLVGSTRLLGVSYGFGVEVSTFYNYNINRRFALRVGFNIGYYNYGDLGFFFKWLSNPLEKDLEPDYSHNINYGLSLGIAF